MGTREHTMVDSLVFGTPRGGAATDRPAQGQGEKGENPKVVAYLSDVFEAPRLRDQMKQYDLVLKNLNICHPKVVAYLSDVFEAPRLRDQMKQYDLVLKNLNKQKSYNEESCKRDMKYHRARYERVYDDIRGTPQSLPPLKGVTSPPWPGTPHSEHPPNTDIYVDTRRSKPGDHVLFKADWRVLKEEFPPKSGQSAIRRQQQQQALGKRSGKSGRSRDVLISWNTPTPDIPDDKTKAKTFVAPGGYFEGSVNNEYGRSIVKAPNLESLYATPRRGVPKPIEIPGMSDRRYKAPISVKDDWKTEAWRRANEEYRRYRDATNLSGVPVNRRVSNFEFGGNIIIG